MNLFFFFQLGKYSVNTKPFDTFDFFFSQFFCSAATKETLCTTVLKKKADLNIPEDILILQTPESVKKKDPFPNQATHQKPFWSSARGELGASGSVAPAGNIVQAR